MFDEKRRSFCRGWEEEQNVWEGRRTFRREKSLSKWKWPFERGMKMALCFAPCSSLLEII
jgi:hypothetical protein